MTGEVTSSRYAVVGANNAVLNIIMWDGVAEIELPANSRTVQSDTLSIGDTSS